MSIKFKCEINKIQNSVTNLWILSKLKNVNLQRRVECLFVKSFRGECLFCNRTVNAFFVIVLFNIFQTKMCFFDCIPLLGGVFVAMSAFWCSYKVFFGSVSRKQLIAKLQGKVVCVTGASSGIGKEIAKLCFDCGAKVILVARRKELLETLKEEMMESLESSDKRKEDIAIVTADLGKLDTVESTGNEILNCFGVVHGLVNNAGIGCRGSVQSTLIDVHQNVMNLNYFSQIVLVKTLLPSMMACNERCWIVATRYVKIRIKRKAAFIV